MHMYLSEIQQQDYKDHTHIIQLAIGRWEQSQLEFRQFYPSGNLP